MLVSSSRLIWDSTLLKTFLWLDTRKMSDLRFKEKLTFHLMISSLDLAGMRLPLQILDIIAGSTHRS